MDFGDEPEGSDSQRQQRRYHRHTPRQIQQLEAMFKECPHPDENQRAALSRELGLEPRQIKFWFQNRRTQMKAQHERADNCFLRAENDKIRCENITMREALKNVVCPNCGGPPVAEDYFDEQKLRMENARLKEELDRVSSMTSKYLGRPFTQMPPVPTMSVSSLDLSMGGMPGQQAPLGGPSLDLDLLSGCSSGMPYQMPAPVTEMERPMMVDMATRAMDELIRLAQAGDQIWVKGMPGDAREVLNVATYDSLFAKPGGAFRPPDMNVEGSRDSGLVFMSAVALVDVFMDTNKWMEFFPGIVSKAQTVDVLVNGLGGRSDSLIMMYEELHIMTPVVPTRELSFLRYCKQIEQGLWAVADVSLDGQRDAHYGIPSRSRRMPSGCLIADMSNGYSKVTWVEHMEIEQMLPINILYRNLVLSGAAFGAHRWLAALQRACERFAALATLGVPHHDIAGVTPEGKRSMMKLSQRMVSSFCASLSSSPLQRWTLLSGTTDVSVRVSTHRSTDSGQPNGVVLSAATSIWLPVPGDHVFAFVRDENARSQWDVLSHGNQVQEVSRIPSGSNPGNCISLLRGLNANQNSMLILQESCTDASGALVVYSPIDIPAANVVMSGEDTSGIPLLPSGFAILPDGRPGSGAGASSSAVVPLAPPPGCVVTVAFQILVSNLPSSRLNAESVATVNSLIGTTVQQIKAALNCAGP
ncbi:homeobox-leucine zipper protein ROC8-like [Miscanthus floridulus]|uniref:homeobox-leucine zipper protein ROC8-like n=1 Tax=Miscanthus floridulus TaxID=154761 RepID=UPI0034585187